ncbi:MAG: hypothetical protein ACO1OB_19310 [Archangium sp.]
MNGVGIDWVAVIVLGAAWVISTIRTIPLSVRNWIFALACFGIAASRLYLGASGLNLLFVGIAVVIGVQYAVRALRSPKQP